MFDKMLPSWEFKEEDTSAKYFSPELYDIEGDEIEIDVSGMPKFVNVEPSDKKYKLTINDSKPPVAGTYMVSIELSDNVSKSRPNKYTLMIIVEGPPEPEEIIEEALDEEQAAKEEENVEEEEAVKEESATTEQSAE